jgi:hypothetical protein
MVIISLSGDIAADRQADSSVPAVNVKPLPAVPLQPQA